MGIDPAPFCANFLLYFIPRASNLFSRMILLSGNRATLSKQLKKDFHRYRTVYQKFGKTHEEVNISIMKNTCLFLTDGIWFMLLQN